MSNVHNTMIAFLFGKNEDGAIKYIKNCSIETNNFEEIIEGLLTNNHNQERLFDAIHENLIYSGENKIKIDVNKHMEKLSLKFQYNMKYITCEKKIKKNNLLWNSRGKYFRTTTHE